MGRLTRICAVWRLATAALLLLAGCQSAPPVANTPKDKDPGGREVTIYVASNGWHSAIVVPRAALPAGGVPEAADFPEAAYLSFGWGDATYFPARDPSFGMALGAAFTPTPAVLHLSGLALPPQDVFQSEEVVALSVTSAGFAGLIAYLDASFARDGAARIEASAPGLHSFSLFYPATGEFHLFNTCNTWTARGLAAAGLPVRASGTVTAEELMVQLRSLAFAVD